MGLITYGAALQNEVKAWPPLVRIGTGFDLVTNNHWWDDEGSPTTKATAVPSSGEAALDAKFTEVIKCITDAADEGFNQRYTYADEPRVKSGAHISAVVWVATTTGPSGITVKLRNSDATSTTGTLVTSDGDWGLIVVEDHTCAGTHVELVVTKDASGTFYAGGPITVMVGADAIALPPRGLRFKWIDGVELVDFAGAADPAAWTDIDITASASALAAIAHCSSFLLEVVAQYKIFIRRNGSSDTATDETLVAFADGGATFGFSTWPVVLDDAGIFEYMLDRTSGTDALDFGQITLRAYEEWE